jgi:hypothetical protein
MITTLITQLTNTITDTITDTINNIIPNKFIFEIDKEKTFIERLRISSNFEIEYPNQIPIILQQSKKNVVKLNKKYLFLSINKNYSIDNLKLKLKENQIYNFTHFKIKKNNNNLICEKCYDINFYINNKFIYNDITFENLHSLYTDSDGLLKMICEEPIAEQIMFDNPDCLPIIIDLNIKHKKIIEYLNQNEYEHNYKMIIPYTYIVNIKDNDISIQDLLFLVQENKNIVSWFCIIDKNTNKYQPISYYNYNLEDIYNEYKDDDGFLRLFLFYDCL